MSSTPVRRHLGALAVALTTGLTAGLSGFVAVAPTSVAGVAAPVGPHTVAATGDRQLLIAGDGEVYGTGSNGAGQLTGTDDPVAGLTRLSGLPDGVDATSLAASDDATYVLGSDGALYATGDLPTGHARSLTRQPALPDGLDVVAVTAGDGFAVALAQDGSAWGRGRNDVHQVSSSSSSRLTAWTELPTPGVTLTAVAAGGDHLVAIGDDGVAYGQGGNADGQLTGTAATVPTLTELDGLPDGVGATSVAAGEGTTIVVGDDGVAYGTGDGDGDDGRLGDAGRTAVLTSVGIDPDDVVSAAALGTDSTTYLVSRAGNAPTVWVSGRNTAGQLGAGVPDDTDVVTTPVHLSGPAGLAPAAELAAGDDVNVVRAASGLVYRTGLTADGSAMPALVAGQRIGTTGKVTTTAPRIGHPVSVTLPSFLPSPATFAYQWRIDGGAVPGATHPTYTPSAGDAGRGLSVTVTATRTGIAPDDETSPSVVVAGSGSPGGSGGSGGSGGGSSTPTGHHLRWHSQRPQLRGARDVGTNLWITKDFLTSFRPQARRLTYQWLRNDRPIRGATDDHYRLTRRDRVRTIVCVITGTRPGWTAGRVRTSSIKVNRT